MPGGSPSQPIRAAAVFPVRFSTAGQAAQCSTREVGTEGVFVSCPSPPPLGAPVSLLLYLPGIPAPEELEALVRAIAAPSDPRAPGFWAEFTALRDEARERIAGVLRRLAQERPHAVVTPSTALQRIPQTSQPAHEPSITPELVARMTPASSLRIPAKAPSSAPPQPASSKPASQQPAAPPAEVQVRFAGIEQFVLEYAANISAGGIFIEMADPPELETHLRVLLHLPDGGPPVAVDACVVHRVEQSRADEKHKAGAGVQFLAGDLRFRDRIEKLLDELVRRDR